MSIRIIRFLFFCFISTSLTMDSVSGQMRIFNQTVKIRPIISEAKTNKSSVTKIDISKGISQFDNTKKEFYLTFETENRGIKTDRWVKLPNDRDWNSLLNQIVNVKGRTVNNKLSVTNIKKLTKLSESYLNNPPPTIGHYKIVTVPLTIEPQNFRVPGKIMANSSNTKLVTMHSILE